MNEYAITIPFELLIRIFNVISGYMRNDNFFLFCTFLCFVNPLVFDCYFGIFLKKQQKQLYQ